MENYHEILEIFDKFISDIVLPNYILGQWQKMQFTQQYEAARGRIVASLKKALLTSVINDTSKIERLQEKITAVEKESEKLRIDLKRQRDSDDETKALHVAKAARTSTPSISSPLFSAQVVPAPVALLPVAPAGASVAPAVQGVQGTLVAASALSAPKAPPPAVPSAAVSTLTPQLETRKNIRRKLTKFKNDHPDLPKKTIKLTLQPLETDLDQILNISKLICQREKNKKTLTNFDRFEFGHWFAHVKTFLTDNPSWNSWNKKHSEEIICKNTANLYIRYYQLCKAFPTLLFMEKSFSWITRQVTRYRAIRKYLQELKTTDPTAYAYWTSFEV